MCRRLDGLPLALELAAALVDVEGVSGLLTTRSSLLSGRDREALAGGIDWSVERASPPARRALVQACAFAGSFTFDMALGVVLPKDADAARAALAELVRTSLIVRDRLDPGRLRLLEPTREVARASVLDDDPEGTLDRHAAVMLERAEQWGPRCRTAEAVVAAAEIRADLADHQRAFGHLLETGAVRDAARLVCAVFEYCLFHLRTEGFTWARQLAERIADDDPLASRILGAAALGAWFSGDDDAVPLAERALDSGERTGGSTVWARAALVDAHGYAGRIGPMFVHLDALVVEEMAPGADPCSRIDGLVFQILGDAGGRDPARAVESAKDAVRWSRQLGNPYCTHWALFGLGQANRYRDPRKALDAFAEAVAANREINSRFNLVLALVEWMSVNRALGHGRDNVSVALDVLDLLTESGNRSQISGALGEIGHLLLEVGCHEVAALALLGRRGLPAMPRGPAADLEDAPRDEAIARAPRRPVAHARDPGRGPARAGPPRHLPAHALRTHDRRARLTPDRGRSVSAAP